MPCIFVYKICRSTFNNKESVIKSSVLFFILRLIQRYGQGIRISSDAYKMVILKEIYGSKSKVFFAFFFFHSSFVSVSVLLDVGSDKS